MISKGEVVDRGLHEGEVNCVSLQESQLASGGDDEKIIIWNLR